MQSTQRVRSRVLAVIGTRPELVKMAPVVARLRARSDRFEVRVLWTAQHRSLLDRAASFFDLRPDVDLDLMRAGQAPADVVRAATLGIERELGTHPVDLVLAQGDTATVLASALAAFHARVPFAHVEAGLRTGDLGSPFPEEGYRRLIASIASLHFAPTDRARRALLDEHVPDARVIVTGNTVIDALLDTVRRAPMPPFELPIGRRLVLATLHRRESFGAPLERIVSGLARLLELRPELELALPVHPNPAVIRSVSPLARHPRVRLLDPLEYPAFVALLSRASLVITDSGGVQEEAPALGVPVLVARETTERPEGIEAGCAELVGTDPHQLVTRAVAILEGPRRAARSPYGDGHASERIVRALSEFLAGRALESDTEEAPACVA